MDEGPHTVVGKVRAITARGCTVSPYAPRTRADVGSDPHFVPPLVRLLSLPQAHKEGGGLSQVWRRKREMATTEEWWWRRRKRRREGWQWRAEKGQTSDLWGVVPTNGGEIEDGNGLWGKGGRLEGRARTGGVWT